MGSSTSKAAKTASKLSASKTARKYPTQTPHTAPSTARPPPPFSNRTNAQPAQSSTQDIDLGLQARLQSLGPVQPNPTLSNTSTYHIASRPGLQHARDKKPASPLSQAQKPNQDPSLTHSNFQPSASNPAQSIFPPSQQDPNMRQNPALSLLIARSRLATDAEHEFSQVGKAGAAGRQFLDVVTLRQVLQMRERMAPGKIEEELGLRRGILGKLGGRGVVGIGS